jgi:lysophospholipase L1-like esterase
LFVKVILNRKSQFQDTYAQVLIISLPIINEETKYASERYIGATEKAKKLTELYSEISSRDNCHFLNASNLEVGADGVHLTEESHIRLAKMLDEKIKSLKI